MSANHEHQQQPPSIQNKRQKKTDSPPTQSEVQDNLGALKRERERNLTESKREQKEGWAHQQMKKDWPAHST